jgi:hypothetical protein
LGDNSRRAVAGSTFNVFKLDPFQTFKSFNRHKILQSVPIVQSLRFVQAVQNNYISEGNFHDLRILKTSKRAVFDVTGGATGPIGGIGPSTGKMMFRDRRLRGRNLKRNGWDG